MSCDGLLAGSPGLLAPSHDFTIRLGHDIPEHAAELVPAFYQSQEAGGIAPGGLNSTPRAPPVESIRRPHRGHVGAFDWLTRR